MRDIAFGAEQVEDLFCCRSVVVADKLHGRAAHIQHPVREGQLRRVGDGVITDQPASADIHIIGKHTRTSECQRTRAIFRERTCSTDHTT